GSTSMSIARPRVPSRLLPLLAAWLACAGIGRPECVHADAATLPTGFGDQSVLSSLEEPVGIAEVPDPPSVPVRRVLFVEQRTARVGLVVGTTQFTVGMVPGVNSSGNEQGLLGITVDPGWPARPYLYVHCTDGRVGQRVAISRFTLTGDLAGTGSGSLAFDAATRYDLITRLPDNAPNHNGGTVRFGAGGMLDGSLGDDAGGCPAPDGSQLVGKILRLDVSRLPLGPGGPAPTALLAPPDNPFAASPDSNAKLVWTHGLRNPFRFQVDAPTAALFISDVGENNWEELDRAPMGGRTMGWPWMEGPDPYITCTGSQPAFTPPIAYYFHDIGAVIICDGVYHAPASGTLSFPAEYEGDCFYSDYYT